MSLRKNIIIGLALCVAVPLSTASTAAAESEYEPGMVAALARTLGTDEAGAVARLDRESVQQSRLDALSRAGFRLDGAFLDQDGNAVISTRDSAAAGKARALGIAVRTPVRGAESLTRVRQHLDRVAARQVPSGIVSWAVDAAADVVRIRVQDGNSPAAKAFLAEAARFGQAVSVERTATRNETTATSVYPGSKMTLNDTTNWCSVGFGAHDSDGNQYLATAGHCVEHDDVLRFDGNQFAQGVGSRYSLGKDSVDMGVAEITSGYSIPTVVGTWKATTSSIAVKGGKKAAVGSSVCKSGATTGWTCGKIVAYDVSVTYVGKKKTDPTTLVTGLGDSSVCVMGGDSGGAWISGNQAQGVTSGGPVDQTCKWNGGYESDKSSYFQPLGDLLSYYGLTLNVQ